MSQLLDVLREIIRNHKMKIVATFALTVIFVILLFPYNDLVNLLTAEIYDRSGQRIYVHAEDLDLALLPTIGVQATNVSIEPGLQQHPRFAPIELETLEIHPLLSALLSFRPGASVSGSGLFGGTLSISASTTGTFFSEPGGARISDFELSEVSLTKLLEYIAKTGQFSLDPALKIGGKVSANSGGFTFDPSPNSKDPLKGELDLSVQNLVLPSQIPFPGFGSLPIPQVKIPQSKFRFKWGGGKMQIVDGKYGSEKDPLSGRILGEVNLLPNGGRGLSLGAFNLCFELNFSQDLYNQFLQQVPILSGFDRFRIQGGPGVRYGIKASGFQLTNVMQWNSQPGNCNSMAGTP